MPETGDSGGQTIQVDHDLSGEKVPGLIFFFNVFCYLVKLTAASHNILSRLCHKPPVDQPGSGYHKQKTDGDQHTNPDAPGVALHIDFYPFSEKSYFLFPSPRIQRMVAANTSAAREAIRKTAIFCVVRILR